MKKGKWFHAIQPKVKEYFEKFYTHYELQAQDVCADRVYETYLVKDEKEIFIVLVVMHRSTGMFSTYKRDF